MKNNVIIPILIAVLFTACNAPEQPAENEAESPVHEEALPQLTSGIQPPALGINVPMMKKQLTAETGGSFVYSSGSIVTFPENAVLHADGSPVSGAFDVEYREFHDPIDIYFSGIPMAYDSMETTYHFVSAGMCELKAYQNGEELIVNPSANPSVDMVSKDADPAHNLYYYDEEQEKWMPKGKPEIKDFEDVEEKSLVKEELPLKPQKIDPKKYSFYISVEELGSEFAGFDDMYFQIADEEKNYDPADAGIQWYSVDVQKSPKMKGKYLVTFSNASQTRTYITDPVFSDEEYEKAIANYNKVLGEKEAQKKAMEAEKAKWDAWQAEIIAQNRIIDSVNQIIALQNEALEGADVKTFKDVKIPQGSYTIQRGFSFDSFGVWNCDNPIFKAQDFVKTQVNYEEPLEIPNFSVIYESYNSVYNNNIGSFRNLPESNEVLFFIEGAKLYYGKVTSQEEEVDLTLKQMDISNISFAEIKKKLLGY